MMAYMTNQSRRADFFVDEGQYRRLHPRTTGDERQLLTDFLAAERATLVTKCAGLEKELALRSVEHSTLSLLGLVRHMAGVERRWFRQALAGQDVPRLFHTEENPDEDFDGAVPEPGVVAEAWEAWRAEVAFAERFVEEAPDLDVEGRSPWLGTVSLRWVLMHMLQEYARHNGHADLLRERIDGARGL